MRQPIGKRQHGMITMCSKQHKTSHTVIYTYVQKQTVSVPECARRHGQQVRRGVKLNALPLVHHHNLGRIQDGGYAMSYSQHGALDKLPSDRLLDKAVGCLQKEDNGEEVLRQA